MCITDLPVCRLGAFKSFDHKCTCVTFFILVKSRFNDNLYIQPQHECNSVIQFNGNCCVVQKESTLCQAVPVNVHIKHKNEEKWSLTMSEQFGTWKWHNCFKLPGWKK